MDICDDPPIFGENTFSLNYRKVNNRDFYSSLEDSQLSIQNSKNYIPIYENYFNMNDTNYNSINLNQRFYVSALSGVIDKNNIQAAVVDAFKSSNESLTIEHKPVFIKFSPLIDPVKYMSGKYENINILDGGVLNIPTLSKLEKQGHSKANDRNNAAYVDSFFSYLSSQVLNCHDFIHGINFYGSFNAIKEDFYYNVIDDIEYLEKNPFFIKNKDVLFSVEDIEYDDYENENENDNENDYKKNKHCKNAKDAKDVEEDDKPVSSHKKNTRNKKEKITIVDKTDGIPESDTVLVTEDFNKLNTELNSIFNLSSDLCTVTATPSDSVVSVDISCSDPLHDIVCDNIVDIVVDSITDGSDSIKLKKYSNDDYDNESDSDSDDSYTSRSCSSRSSYTSDSQNDTKSDGLGSDCDMNDVICLDDTKISNSDEESEDDNEKQKEKGKENKKEKEKEKFCSGGNGNKKNGNKIENVCDDNSDCDYDDDDDDDESYDMDDDDETLWATIKNFPVSAIMLEKCDNTLDYLMMQEKEMTENEWRSALMQIIMTLITYQKLFGFTHNDLHTNNIMFIYTQKEYIYYHYNKKYYRIPTYNRTFKIIDFGRAIYKYKSKVICSDSFSMSGDAATQYNCEPYFNDKKPRLEPNFSFDLCRLGCSIFDYFIDDMNNVASICKKDPLAKLIVEWVTDDHNRNILYKANGEERYPDFKLYKMIARNVHNHLPHMQLSKPLFAEYEFPKKKIKSSHRIINIDKMPCYMV